MHVDAGTREGPGAGSEEFGDLLVGGLQGLGHRRRQQRRQRGPGTGGPAQRQQGVHPRARAQGVPRDAGPDLGGVRDQRRVAHAVHLRHDPEHRGGVRILGVRRAHLDPQRQPDTRVVPGGDIVRPRAEPGAVQRLPRGVGGPARHPRGGGGAGERVGDGVQEGAHQAFGLGQPQRTGAVHRHGVRLGRHRGGEQPEPFRVLGPQWTDTPGVVVGRGQAGQQQPARHQVQGVHGRRAPEHGRPVPARVGTRAREHRQRRPHGQQYGGHLDRLDTAVGGHDDRQAHRVSRGDGGRRRAVGPPEGDPAGTGGVTGHEHGVTAGQFGDLRQGCRRRRLLGDDVFLKFD
ncbi:hypothetical protein SFUMM280S_00461 [Streptomyces fumanus]